MEVYAHWSLVHSRKAIIFTKIISLFVQFLSAVYHTEFYTIKLFFPDTGKLFIELKVFQCRKKKKEKEGK